MKSLINLKYRTLCLERYLSDSHPLIIKKKKKKNAKPYKKKQPLIHGTKETKKKIKNPKTQIVFLDQNSYSLRRKIKPLQQ